MIYRRFLNTRLTTSAKHFFGLDAKTITIGVPKEVYQNEKRVAVTPDTIQRIAKKNGCTFLVETGAGLDASITDEAYQATGAKIVSAKEALHADVVLKVRMPQFNPTINQHEVEALKEGATVISFIQPAQNKELVQQLK
jgi:NAD/NADP transhydrogenase alpha subunit